MLPIVKCFLNGYDSQVSIYIFIDSQIYPQQLSRASNRLHRATLRFRFRELCRPTHEYA